MKHTTVIESPFRRPLLCWHTRAQIGWRDTAAASVTLTGLPSINPGAFSPELRAHIDNRATIGSQTFSYTVSPGLLFGGNRCVEHLASGDHFTAVPGSIANCELLSFAVGSANGSPSDITVSSPLGEGRVVPFLVRYSETNLEPCGDGVCDLSEDSTTCPEDCVCGNERCDGDESFLTCPGDCPNICGDGDCRPPETRNSCPEDCCAICGR